MIHIEKKNLFLNKEFKKENATDCQIRKLIRMEISFDKNISKTKASFLIKKGQAPRPADFIGLGRQSITLCYGGQGRK